MIRSFLLWYLALQFFALVGLPASLALFRRLPSRGYAAAKAVGLLLSGVLLWWGGILQLWSHSTGALLSAAAVVFLVGLWALRGQRGELRLWWRTQRRFCLVVEILFFAALLLWALVRASQPQIQTAGGEKWMEIAFLNSVLRAPTLPPHDPWLSGYAISYYYLGYLLLGNLTRLTGIASTIAFNLGNAAWFALSAIGAYALLYDLLAWQEERERPPLASPLLAPLLLLLVGNGEGLLEIAHARGWFSARFWAWLDLGRLAEPPQPPFTPWPTRFLWWWQASRTLRDYAPWGDRSQAIELIDEFPAFSFLLGDMHPHLLALPFVLLVIALALQVYRRARARTLPAGPPAWPARLWPFAGYAVFVGALGFLNTWDMPIYWALLVAAFILGRYREREGSLRSFLQTVWQAVPEALGLGVLSVLVYLPFWFALRSQAGGVLPNLFHATRLPLFVVMFLPLLLPLAGVLVSGARAAKVRWWRILLLGVGMIVAFLVIGLLVGSVVAYPYLMVILRGESIMGYSLTPAEALDAIGDRWLNPWTTLLVACGSAAAILALLRLPFSTREKAQSPSQERLHSRLELSKSTSQDVFPLLLALLGLGLVLAPEFVYLQDVFVTRMNTVFKFYFQAWVLWSLAGAWQVARWLRHRDYRLLLAALALVLMAGGLAYTVLAIPTRAREQGVPWTLDGAAWLAEARPADAQAIAWLNEHVAVAGDHVPVIVEAPAEAHRAYVYEGRVSAFTGLPTVLGWSGHERQWRGNYVAQERRERDLQTLYATTDLNLTRQLLTEYGVDYVYVGPVEQNRYPAEGLAKFAQLYPAVYARDGVTIYRVAE